VSPRARLLLAAALAGAVVLAWAGLSGVTRFAGRGPGLGGPAASALSRQFQVTQRSLNQTLSRHVRLAARGESPHAVAMVLGVAFAYGVLHSLGPGHGKVVVASLVLGRGPARTRAIAIGFVVSLLQIASSIGLVAVLAFVLGHRGTEVVERSVGVELVSYGLIGLVGLYMVADAALPERWRPRHRHAALPAPTAGARGLTASAVVAAGLTPCPSAIIVLLFALAAGSFSLGVVASLVMAAGMGLTLAVVALAAVLGRRLLLGPGSEAPRSLAGAVRVLRVVAGLALTGVGLWLARDAWTRLT
jgi:ABC-type nickel/cobalt efflux system permease component RcnA